jgi:hypothetical protein
MPLIDLPDLNQNFEPSPVPEGSYDLRIANCEAKDSKAGKPMYQMMMIVEDNEYPNAQPINFFLSIPQPNDDQKTMQFKMQNIKRFLTAFDIPFEASGFNDEDVVGATARQISVTQTEPTEEGLVYNEMHLPRVK